MFYFPAILSRFAPIVSFNELTSPPAPGVLISTYLIANKSDQGLQPSGPCNMTTHLLRREMIKYRIASDLH
ncbi:unnamed protein product [Protopolystoma xenopodis]|uniref:Uncharacterized protein n=1 Tax=Protopolystoma xenopodis TaxID=117903 RepID=A0A3S5FDK3_9PLAT|nr:unnamed protein product [Protopolystoma xenopodis]